MAQTSEAYQPGPSSSSVHSHHYSSSAPVTASLLETQGSTQTHEARPRGNGNGPALFFDDGQASSFAGHQSQDYTGSLPALSNDNSQILVASIVQRLVKRVGCVCFIFSFNSY